MNALSLGSNDAMTNITIFMRDPAQIWSWFALLVCLLVAWGLSAAVRHILLPRFLNVAMPMRDYTRVTVASILFPVLLAVGAGVTAVVFSSRGRAADLPRIAAVLAGTYAVILIVVYSLTRALKPVPVLATSGHLIVWLIWTIAAVAYLGWFHPLTQSLERVAITVGGRRLSLMDGARNGLIVLVFLLVAAYLGRLIERRLMRTEQLPAGVRIGLAKSVRLGMIILAALIAFNILGIDLGGLTVFSGALGVGLGFGFQRIASNYISGFILVGDRSIRPGDVITVGTRFGVVRELRARYVVVRDRDGVDTLIPNETLITSEVINWSYSDRSVRLKLPVQISYRDDPRHAITLMQNVARRHPRIEATPEAAGRVMGFGANGIDLELRVWIVDPEDGVNNVRSDMYLEIWDVFKAAGITIPYPQRDVHVQQTPRAD